MCVITDKILFLNGIYGNDKRDQYCYYFRMLNLNNFFLLEEEKRERLFSKCNIFKNT